MIIKIYIWVIRNHSFFIMSDNYGRDVIKFIIRLCKFYWIWSRLTKLTSHKSQIIISFSLKYREQIRRITPVLNRFSIKRYILRCYPIDRHKMFYVKSHARLSYNAKFSVGDGCRHILLCLVYKKIREIVHLITLKLPLKISKE